MSEKPCLKCKRKIENVDKCNYRRCMRYTEWYSREWRNIRRVAEEVRNGRRQK